MLNSQCGFFFKNIYYQVLSNRTNNLSSFHRQANQHSIVQIEISILFTRKEKLRPREDDWYPNDTMNSKDKRIHLRTLFMIVHWTDPNFSYMKLSPTFMRNQTKYNKLLIFGGDNWTFFFFNQCKDCTECFLTADIKLTN